MDVLQTKIWNGYQALKSHLDEVDMVPPGDPAEYPRRTKALSTVQTTYKFIKAAAFLEWALGEYFAGKGHPGLTLQESIERLRTDSKFILYWSNQTHPLHTLDGVMSQLQLVHDRRQSAVRKYKFEFVHDDFFEHMKACWITVQFLTGHFPND